MEHVQRRFDLAASKRRLELDQLKWDMARQFSEFNRKLDRVIAILTAQSNGRH
jgi:hypothetical protein